MTTPEKPELPELQDPEEGCDEECEPSTALLLFDYLESDKGHEIVTRVLRIFEDLQKNTVEKSVERIKFDRFIQVTIILAIIIAASILTWFGKFDSTVAVLFGAVVGYMFGKRGA